MSTGLNISNLDSLIISDDDRPTPLLKIHDETESKCLEHVSDSSEHDSDSSYEAKAIACANEMDGLIAEATMERDEKDRRIRQARLDKLKEKEDKQNPFGRKVNASRGGRVSGGGRASGSGSSNAQRILSTKSTSGKSSKKSRNAVQNIAQVSTIHNKKTICTNVVQEICENERKNVRSQNNISSRLKNVTIQDWDVASTDTCSDYDTGSDFEMDHADRNIRKQPKTFTIKHLNKVEMLDLETFFDSDESDDKPDEKRCYYSAEKSSAANRRKKSNYLNKRRSKYKPSNPNVQHQLEWTANKDLGLPEINFWNSDPRSEQVNNQIKCDNGKQKSNYKGNIVESNKFGLNVATSSTVHDSSISVKSKPNNKFKKRNKSKNLGDVNHPVSLDEDPGQPKENVASGSITTTQNLDLNSSVKVKSKSKHKKNLPNAYTDMKLQDEKESKLKKLNDERIIPKYSGSHQISDDKKPTLFRDDIIIVNQISLINNTSKDDSKLLDLKKDPSNSSNDEIDWKAITEIHSQSAKNPPLIVSSDSEDIDFKAIVESRNKGADEANVQSSNKEAGNTYEDSSDFEAELDACLVKFK